MSVSRARASSQRNWDSEGDWTGMNAASRIDGEQAEQEDRRMELREAFPDLLHH